MKFDKLSAKKKSLDEIGAFAREGMAKGLKSKFSKKPAGLKDDSELDGMPEPDADDALAKDPSDPSADPSLDPSADPSADPLEALKASAHPGLPAAPGAPEDVLKGLTPEMLKLLLAALAKK